MASESSSFSNASWQTYSTSPSFTLSSGNGTKTVYFKVRNSANTESTTVSDSITLNESTTTTSITVASPNGGETWQAGSTKTISWNYTGSPGSYVKIELLKNDSTYTTITSSTSTGSSGSGSYNWMIPASQTTGSDYKIRVTSTTNSSYTDTSNSNFTISSSKSDLVIQNLSASPSSGSAGSSTTVSFTIYNQGNGTANSSTTNIRINSSSSGVSTSDTLLTSISTSSISSGGTSYVNQSVTIPSSFSAGTYYIWGWADVNNTANQSDTSNDKTKTSFTISGGSPTITVTSPNGAETWQAGSTKTISWNYTGSPGSYVKIELLKNDSTNTTITSSASIGGSGSGSYNWTIPSSQAAGSDYKVKVTSTSNSSYYDYSDNNFTITTSVTIPSTPTGTSPGSTSSPGPTQSSSTVTLSWGAVSGVNYYDLGVRDMETNNLVVNTTTTGTSYTASLTAGHQYRWNVAACNSAGCSSYSTRLYFRTP